MSNYVADNVRANRDGIKNLFKTLMALPYVWEPSQHEGALEMSIHMVAHKGKQLFFPTDHKRRPVGAISASHSSPSEGLSQKSCNNT